MVKRIFLFFLVNILVVITITIVTSFFGVNQYMSARGLNYEILLIFCLLWGFGGACISLIISKWTAKFMMGIESINPENCSIAERDLFNRVAKLAQKAGLPNTPEIGIYNNPELNAFATGPSKSRALLAVSSGLLQHMTRSEVDGVLAHEITHIANGDMVTMTLIQGIVNVFVMFFSRIIAYSITQVVKENIRPLVNTIVVLILEVALSMLGLIVVTWFSRAREFKADKGGAQLIGKFNMISTLKALQKAQEYKLNEQIFLKKEHASLTTLKISNKEQSFYLIATHPPLEQRIQALQDNKLLP